MRLFELNGKKLSLLLNPFVVKLLFKPFKLIDSALICDFVEVAMVVNLRFFPRHISVNMHGSAKMIVVVAENLNFSFGYNCHIGFLD
jgi:hypothetical protein